MDLCWLTNLTLVDSTFIKLATEQRLSLQDDLQTLLSSPTRPGMYIKEQSYKQKTFANMLSLFLFR